MERNRLKILAKNVCGAILLLAGWASVSYSNVTNVSVTVNKTGAEFYSEKMNQPGDVTVHIENDLLTQDTFSGGSGPGVTAVLDLIAAGAACNGSATALANDLSISNLTLADDTQDFNPTFRILMSRPGGQSSTKFRVTVTSATTVYACSTATINIYDFVSAAVTVNKVPSVFFSGKTIQPGDVTVTVVSSNTTPNVGLESWMHAQIDLVPLLTNTTYPFDLSENDLPVGPWGATTISPQFRVLRYFATNSARFQVTITSATGATLYPKVSGNDRVQSGAISAYDFLSASVEVRKTPRDFFTGKNVQPGDLRIIVLSSGSANVYGGLEDWMRVKLDLVSESALEEQDNDLSTTTLALVPGSTSYTMPSFSVLRPFTGDSVRFRVTISSADDSVLYSTTTPNANPVYSANTINVYDFLSASVEVRKLPREFYTGKNLQPGDLRIIVLSSGPANVYGGLESWMRVNIDLVSPSGITPLANDLSVDQLTLAAGATSYNISPFHILRPFTGDSVRFQVTIASASGGTLISTTTPNANPVYSAANVSAYDYVSGDIKIRLSPPTFTVTSDVSTGAFSNQGVIINMVSSATPNYFEPWMRLSVRMIDSNGATITNAVSPTLNPLSVGATFFFPSFTPYYATLSETARFVVTFTSAGTGVQLVPRPTYDGVNVYNGSTSTIIQTNSGLPAKYLILPPGETWLRPHNFGRANVYDEDNPYEWRLANPSDPMVVNVVLTDVWSNPIIGLNNTPVEFADTPYLERPSCSNTNSCVVTDDVDGTSFTFNLKPWEIVVPLTATGGYTTDTIYFMKFGLPNDQIFVGPSPFNPKTGGLIYFAFQVDQTTEVKIIIYDVFGRQVWETSVSAIQDEMNRATSWNGRNQQGELVAAGVYWAVLERDGNVKSKTRFGVVK